jgi:hypothetical protein
MNKNEVKDFIVKIRYLYENNKDIRDIIDIDELIQCLEELNSLVEIFSVKSVIVGHIKALIVSNLKNKGVEIQEENLLHTVFYGHPGVGKSKTAKILARIWKSLKFIRESQNKNINCEEILDKSNKLRELYINLYKEYLKPEFKDCKNMWLKKEPLWSEIRTRFAELGDSLSYKIQNKNEIEDKYIVVAGREDFVAEYTGQTSIKTLNFLKSCKGKCIIIEEAYVLCSNESDTYGMEALTVLNRFMDEHPRDVIIIFTGYEDKLKNTIFRIQPGLIRRCQWLFNLKGYTYEGLQQIFTQQLQNNGWTVLEDCRITEFFKENFDSFPNFGGDTLKLTYHCKMIYSEQEVDIMFNNSGISDREKIISFEIIEKAFKEYKNNIIM